MLITKQRSSFVFPPRTTRFIYISILFWQPIGEKGDILSDSEWTIFPAHREIDEHETLPIA